MATRGSTQTFTVTLADESVDLTQQSHVYAAVKQGNTTVKKQDDALTVTSNGVSFWLTQEESLKFQQGDVEVQINWTYDNGKRGQTKIATVPFDRTLLPEVLE